MSDNIIIHMSTDKVEIELNEINRVFYAKPNHNKNINVNSNKHYDYVVDINTITLHPVGTKLKLKEIKRPSFFKDNYFIYDNQIYVVEIRGFSDSELEFFDPHTEMVSAISIAHIHNLCEIKKIY